MDGNKQITVAVLGAGSRGQGFGWWVSELPHLAKVVGVAEPRKDYREEFARKHKLESNMVFPGWKEFLAGPKLCDAVVISTMDQEHTAPAVLALEKGYHLLLEKPMATTLEECRKIEAAQRKAGTMVAVCHSMRYHQGLSKVREVLESGAVGRLMSLDQIEQVAYWHQAHSYVRGNWRTEREAAFMLMAKSCHDLDYIYSLVNRPCQRVASAGSLSFFKKEFAPKGSTERCTDGCAVEPNCPYSALKMYVHAEREHWPASVVSLDHSREAHMEAIKTGPYGRCVWRCDNDVVDHQVVMMEFEGGCTATFTMTGFTQGAGRSLRLHGTEGEIYFNEEENAVIVKKYAGNITEKIQLSHESGGHGGGDLRVIRSWLTAIREKDPSLILTNAQESLKTHTLVFAAEKARKEKRMVELSEMN
jgi:predicted dehydrogenase